MERDVPLKVAAFAGATSEVIQKRPSGKGLLRVAARVANTPVVFERYVDARARRILAHRVMAGAHGLQIFVSEFLHRRAPEIVPKPVGVHFVANDKIRRAPMRIAGARITLGNKLEAGAQRAQTFRRRRVERAEPIGRLSGIIRMQQDLFEPRITRFVSEENETDHHAAFRERFNLPVQAGQSVRFEEHRFAINNPLNGSEPVGQRNQLADVDVEGCMFNAQREGILNHLDLQALLTGHRREWIGIGRSILRAEKSGGAAEEPGDRAQRHEATGAACFVSVRKSK
jgi:hypothetical protein